MSITARFEVADADPMLRAWLDEAARFLATDEEEPHTRFPDGPVTAAQVYVALRAITHDSTLGPGSTLPDPRLRLGGDGEELPTESFQRPSAVSPDDLPPVSHTRGTSVAHRTFHALGGKH